MDFGYIISFLTFIITCRKWNRLCVSYDFKKNQAQVAFGGKISDLIVDPEETGPNMNGWGEFLRNIYYFNICNARELR